MPQSLENQDTTRLRDPSGPLQQCLRRRGPDSRVSPAGTHWDGVLHSSPGAPVTPSAPAVTARPPRDGSKRGEATGQRPQGACPRSPLGRGGGSEGRVRLRARFPVCGLHERLAGGKVCLQQSWGPTIPAPTRNGRRGKQGPRQTEERAQAPG